MDMIMAILDEDQVVDVPLLDVGDVIRATPDEIQQRLLQIGETIGQHRWEIGDTANRIMYELYVTRQRVTMGTVCAAVALMCKGEISPSTVQKYSLNADFYSLEERQRYDPLPWSLFEFARMFGDRWRVILDFAMEYLAEYGHPPTRVLLDRQFEGLLLEAQQDMMPSLTDGGVDMLQSGSVVSSAVTPSPMPVSLAIVQGAVRQIMRAVDDLPLDAEKRQRLRALAREMAEMIGYIP
jgi:hypothetical protein